MQITLNRVTYTYDDAPAAALVPVSATFPEGWTGIVGNNGAGKTTLLRVVCDQLAPTAGTVVPPGLSGVYCAQATETCPELAAEFVADCAGAAARLRGVLGVGPEWVRRYDTLSHGERKRLQVAVALWRAPAVLALDEPTNHVDAPTRERLLRALGAWRGVGLLVSHDRELLDTLVYQCLFLSPGRATMRPGPYSEGREQERRELLATTRERQMAKAELARLREIKTRRAEEAARADARRSKRGIARGDKDAKGRIDLAIYTGQDGRAGKRSVQMDSRLVAAEDRLVAARVEKSYDSSLWLATAPSPRRVLVELPEGRIYFGATPAAATPAAAPPDHADVPGQSAGGRYLAFPRLVVGPTDRVGLTGANGAGKSTLLGALLRQCTPDLPLLYIPQELTAAASAALLRELKALSPGHKGQLLSIVARLNSDPDRVLAGEALSPGELRKIMLAAGIVRAPQLIVMDEPTNHLDLSSIEALEEALAGCPCALLLVSHDRRFLQRTTTRRWEFVIDSAGNTEIRESHSPCNP